MSATPSAPAARSAFHYVVLSPFLSYAKGDVITDSAAIAAVEKQYWPHVVRVTAPSS
jgi:hypothetical protein